MIRNLIIAFIVTLLVSAAIVTVLIPKAGANEIEGWTHQEGTMRWKGAAPCGFGYQLWHNYDDDKWYSVQFAHGIIHLGTPQESSSCQYFFERYFGGEDVED